MYSFVSNKDRESRIRESHRGRSKLAHFECANDEISSTAPYHRVTQPRAHRGPRSCPGESVDHFERFEATNRSFESEFRHPREEVLSRRRGFLKYGRHRHATSEYGSGDPSPTNLYSSYNRTLDDSESDSWAIENEKNQRIRELENKLHEHRGKLKEYKERLRAERDLRIVNERNMMEEIERLRRERKREDRDRKENDQRYINLINHLRTKLSLVEQQQRFGGGSLMASLSSNAPVASTSNGAPLGAGESLCTMSSSFMQQVDFTQSTLQRDVDSVDETKNFRSGEPADLETPRGSSLAGRSKTFTDEEPLDLERARTDTLTTSSGSLGNTGDVHEATILKPDDSDGGYVTTSEFLPKSRHMHSETELSTITLPGLLTDSKK
ncbi:unnamed protein product [Toxocara canis]|uniref:Uncharacterized protein n=1 Tax=Toxocara canis TaxID=6265 RepID=A0A183VCC7_TOXCA|nr:unnamed protein product [Toxocara canis]